MKKILVLWMIIITGIALIGCGGSSEDASTAEAETTAPVQEAAAQSDNKITIDNAFYYTHINGHGDETERVAFVLFEYEQLATVKYQVAYIACTCRGPEVNYYSVAYVELSKEDGSVAFLSYDEDSSGHYTAGMYGDSVETWNGTPAKELFRGFREEVLTGASQDIINAIAPMHGEVDTYTGATVTPNNAVSMFKSLFKYHNERYM